MFSWQSPRRTWSAGSCSTTAATRCARSKGYDSGEIPRVDRRAFPAGVLSNAPDGTLYVVDMLPRHHRASHLPPLLYLRDHIVGRKLDRPTGQGRIYRVVHDTTVRDISRVLVKRFSPEPGDGAVASQRLAARDRPAAARRARLPVDRAGTGDAGQAARRTGGRVSARCGRSTDWTPSRRSHRAARARGSIPRGSGCPRFASRSDGWTGRTCGRRRRDPAADRRSGCCRPPAGRGFIGERPDRSP